MIPDREYLEREHLLICVKAVDGEESYGTRKNKVVQIKRLTAMIGEGCVSLLNYFGEEAVPFSCQLTHFGEKTVR